MPIGVIITEQHIRAYDVRKQRSALFFNAGHVTAHVSL